MKKFIIAVAVLGMYALYSLGLRHQSPVIGKPSVLSNNTQTNSSTGSTANSSGNNTPGSGSSNTTSTTKQYKDGTYTGSEADAYYGTVQVSVSINGGKIAGVKFLKYPDTHSTSVMINQQAIPYLQQEAIRAQNANGVQIISGATFTSQAFIQSLSSALSQA